MAKKTQQPTEVATMTQENPLARIASEVPAVASNAADVLALSKVGNFLPRIDQLNALSKLVTDKGKKAGDFILAQGADRFVELGSEFEMFAIDFRTTATEFVSDKPRFFYDRKSEDFQRIMKIADATQGLSGVRYGPEFLIWIPSQNTFATYHFGNPTQRRVVPDLLEVMKKGEDGNGEPIYGPAYALVKAHFIVRDKQKWWGPQIFPNSAELPAPRMADFEVQYRQRLEEFKNPKATPVPEQAAPGEASTRAR